MLHPMSGSWVSSAGVIGGLRTFLPTPAKKKKVNKHENQERAEHTWMGSVQLDRHYISVDFHKSTESKLTVGNIGCKTVASKKKPKLGC